MPRNIRSTLVYMDCGYEPTTGTPREWERYVGPYVIFDGLLNLEAIRELLGSRCVTPTTRTPQGRTIVNADFVLRLTQCAELPGWLNGAIPMGRYLSAVNVLGNGVLPLTLQLHDCPHCAYLKSTEILSQATGVNTDYHRPSIYYVGPESSTDDVEITVEMDTNGRVTFSSATEKLEFIERGCASCGFPGHSRGACPRQRHYAKIGVEIEGRFSNLDELLERAESDGLDVTSDGSIRYGTTVNCEPREIRTKPDLLAGCLRQVSKYYPDEADRSCGMHVHVSFQDTASISTLICPEFYEYFHARWMAWGQRMNLPEQCEFYKRLHGENDYCLKNEGRDFDTPYRTDRYRQLNFTSWERHQTVECRLLPMFREARLGLSAITELISIYEDWLNGACDAHLPYTATPQQTEMNLNTAVWSDTSTVETDFGANQAALSAEIELADLPPVPEGHRRIMLSELSPSVRSILVNVLAAA